MKTTFRFLCLLLSLVMMLGLVAACTDAETPSDTPDDTPSDETPDTPTPEQTMIDIVKDGVTSYRIVRGDLYTTADVPTRMAVGLREAIIAATGAQPDITTDYTEQSADVPELIVGKTNRAVGEELLATLGRDRFLIYCDGKDVVLTGITDTAVDEAVTYFIATYLGFDAETGSYSKTACAIPEDLQYVGTFELPPDVYVINDIRYIDQKTNDEDWNDMVRLYTSLQGRLNKNAKENGFFVYQIDANAPYNSTNDRFWLDYIMGDGKLLDGSTLIELHNWNELWEALGSYVTDAGLVVWDPNVPATANVAATICSVEGYLPVRYDTDADSLYTWLTGKGVEVKLSLVDMFTRLYCTKVKISH